MHEPEIDRWIVCVTGFLQPEGKITGVVELQEKIRRQCVCPRVVTELKSWNDNPWYIAERIWRFRPRNVVLVGYSYGGFTAALVARELAARNSGIRVDAMVLSDAVWRPAANWPSIRSLFNGGRIEIPRNVRRLWSWTQTTNKPCGHELIVDEKYTTWVKECVPDIRHQYMDDLEAFHEVALEVACPGSPTTHVLW